MLTMTLQAQEETPWRLFGSNEVLFEDFDVSGDESSSPYRLEGSFFTDRLNLGVGYKPNGWRELVIRAEILGTNNDYFAHEGAVLASLSVNLEDGGSAVPYRFGAGDLFVDFSRRTLQRQIRGTTIEVQPSFSGGDHSFILATGSGEPDWSDTFDDGGDIYFNGISYLWSSSSGTTSLVANLIDASHAAGAEGAVPALTMDRDQLITSLFGQTKLRGLDLEAEVSMVDDDPQGDAMSVYAEVADNEGRLSWRARFEENELGYQPIGALGVIPDYRVAEAHARYALTPRSTLRGRVQRIDQNLDSTTLPMRRTNVLGMAWDARPIANRPFLRMEANVDINDMNVAGAGDQMFQSYRFRIADRITDAFDLSYELKVRDSDDDAAPAFDRRLLEHELMLGQAVRWGDVQGRIRGGAAYRRQFQNAAYESWSPLLEANLTSGEHDLRLHFGFMDQRFLSPLVADLEYQTRRLIYAYTPGNHAFALEVGDELRDRSDGAETESRRIALRYRYTFERTF
jgi:hypothetical protein